MADDLLPFGSTSTPQASLADTTEIIFRAHQLGLMERARQRQAQQATIDTFMAIGNLMRQRTDDEMRHIVASATLEEKARSNILDRQLRQDNLDLDREKLQAEIEKANRPATAIPISPEGKPMPQIQGPPGAQFPQLAMPAETRETRQHALKRIQ